MTDLRGKVAVVTGGAGGIGRGVAVRLAERGATVVVGGRSAERAQGVLDEIAALGATGAFIAGDVRSLHDMRALAAGTADRFGGIDIVVANAGGNDDEARDPRVRGPFGEIDLERATAFVGQAIAAKLFVVQAALPHLRAGDGGSVVFVTSEGGRVPTPGQTAIATFSGGLIQVGKLLSKELARDRVRVNTVCVTVVAGTPSWEAAFEKEDAVSLAHRRQYEKILERAPLGVATPPDIAAVVAFLASDDAAFLTGAVLSPTGGLTLH
ncbi:SDR family NAD(P)-dependent oxidoreductase [Microbacterium sp. No. 7]|uniref:SDR family NAD(P)-dependent oxidoreductase n=1 Tax=Microbacterium sp. No. 7 TaxID=1714373 RepID=UPI0006D0D3C3|nr:SDR family oxidoreductase [Microbacterium sp. No. 7]ALJ21010.1 3-oxoacyl-ACP reductase [Microbacterium sp. No. 7]